MFLGSCLEREVDGLPRPPILTPNPSFLFQPRSESSSSSFPFHKSQAPSSSLSSRSSGDSARITLTKKVSLSIGLSSLAILGGTPACKASTLFPFWGRQRSVATPKGMPEKARKRILIMMSDTGGGHRASAMAIKAGFLEKYKDDYEVLIEDIWKDHCPPPYNKMPHPPLLLQVLIEDIWKDHCPPPFNKLPDGYGFLVKHSWLWWSSYMLMQPKFTHVPYLRAVHLCVAKRLHRMLNDIKPDLVVSVHPLMQHIPLRIIRSRVKSGVTRCFVPTEFCHGIARKNGLSEKQIVMHGLPIRPIFSKPLPSKQQMRKILGMDLKLPAVLLVGGGEGFGKLEATVDELALRVGNSCQVVVICGRNKKLLSCLQSKNYLCGMKVFAFGFIDNMHEYMRACDAIITKAGPGTIAEALISGLPILLNGNIPGQEEGNIPYVLDNGVGAFERNPSRIADIMSAWLLPGPGHETDLVRMAARSKALGRPKAVYQIVDDLARLAHVPDFSCGPAKVAVDVGRVPL